MWDNYPVPTNDEFDLNNPAEPNRATAATKPKKKLWPRILLWTLVGIFAIGVAAAAVFVFKLNSSFNQAEKLPATEVFPEESSRPTVVEGPEDDKHDALNILLLGSDTRGEVGDDLDDIRGQRSDVIMVAHIPADRQSVQVMSLMRDNWVEIPGHGNNKINAALSLGGVPLVVQTVEGIIDTRIDNVAIIDFDGFEGLTDALGGVRVYNPTAFSVGKTQFAEGNIMLNGVEALKFVRERYAFADGDYTRAANQQRYVKGVLSTFLSKDTLLNPLKISAAVDSFAPYLTVDEGMSASFLVKLGSSMSDVRPGDIEFFTSPTLGTGREGKQSVVVPDWDELAVIAQHFRDDSLGEYLKNK